MENVGLESITSSSFVDGFSEIESKDGRRQKVRIGSIEIGRHSRDYSTGVVQKNLASATVARR